MAALDLRRRERQRVLAEVEVVDVRVEPLGAIDLHEGQSGVNREGLAMTPIGFISFWASTHGYQSMAPHEQMEIPCRRIEWRYLDEEVPGG